MDAWKKYFVSLISRLVALFMTMLSIKFDSCVQQLLLWIGKLPVPVRDTSVCDTGSHVEHDNGTLALNAVMQRVFTEGLVVSTNRVVIAFAYIQNDHLLVAIS